VGHVVGVAAAHGPEGSQEPPCLADVKRLCARVPPTGSFVQGCLEQHLDELSPKCRKQVRTVTDDATALTDACERDLDRLCAEQRTVAGERVSCLIQHRDALSAKCRDQLDRQSGK
jgi:hypothetical protein